PAAYDLIGKVYAKVQSIEPIVKDARPVAQIGLFQAPQQERPGSRVSGTDEGATRMLTQLKHQFDVVGPDSDFAKYELLILPDSINVDDPLRKRLSSYLKSGGKLLATGMSGIAADFSQSQLPQLGV